MDASEKKALSDIEKYGCHVLSVLEDEHNAPFSYSIGIELSSQQPELVVLGLKHELAHWIINEYNRRVRAGESFQSGQRYSGFLTGFDVELRQVDRSHYHEHFGWALWLYKGPTFRVFQAIWPTTSGVWPWEEGASEWYCHMQPVLSASCANKCHQGDGFYVTAAPTLQSRACGRCYEINW